MLRSSACHCHTGTQSPSSDTMSASLAVTPGWVPTRALAEEELWGHQSWELTPTHFTGSPLCTWVI